MSSPLEALDTEPAGGRSSDMAESVSTTHSLSVILDFASRLYGRVALREMRTHTAVRMFVAGLGLAVRAARQQPDVAKDICRKAGIKANRLEVRITRLIVGRRDPRHQDQVHRWANAAAYIAHPPNGDAPPSTWRDAYRYIGHRNGYRKLSDLYAKRAESAAERASPHVLYNAPGASTTDQWLTPQYIFDALGLTFDLDPASPGANVVPWIPARDHYVEGGLEKEWRGLVWCNPPYGRGVLQQWVDRFVRHGRGIILVPERTSTEWWQSLLARADLLLAVSQKIAFANEAGEQTSQFPIGSHLVAIGDEAVEGLVRAARAGLGMLLHPVSPDQALELCIRTPPKIPRLSLGGAKVDLPSPGFEMAGEAEHERRETTKAVAKPVADRPAAGTRLVNRQVHVYSPPLRASKRAKKRGIACSLRHGIGCQHAPRCRAEGRCLEYAAQNRQASGSALAVSGHLQS